MAPLRRASRPRIATLALTVCCGSALTTASATAQDLFEIEVFSPNVTPAGRYEVEVHTNALSRGGSLMAGSSVTAHQPVHVSFEISRGWAGRLETGVFLQTAPFGSSQGGRFAGGHVRVKIRLVELARIPVRIALGGEYSINRATFSHEIQTAEIRPIVGFEEGRLSLALNPSFEMVTNGDAGLEPTLGVSARAGWRIVPSASVAVEYFSRPAATRHLALEEAAHHLLFAGIDIDVSRQWELGLGAGRCITSDEPWVMKSVIGYRF